MKPLLFFPLAILFLLLSNCTPYYLSSNFSTQTADHKIVAVLPFEMVYTGVRPEGITEEDLRTIEVAESQAFQISFYNEILRSTRSGRKPIRVDLQDYKKTLQLLEEKEIGIKDSWDKKPEDLAEILKVDAVVRARVEKNRLMSDLASYGIDVAVHVLDVLSDHTVWPWLPPNVTKSKEIRASYSLMGREEGLVLWSVAIREDANWRRRANEIIDDINRRGSKKFPYRKE